MFSSARLAHLEHASRVLLSPLTVPDPETWRTEVLRAVRDLFDAGAGTFGLPGAATTQFAGDGVDDGVLRDIHAYLGPTWSGAGRSPDPAVDAFHQAVAHSGPAAWDFPLIDKLTGGQVHTMAYYQEVMVPGRITDTQTMFVPTPGGSAMIEVHALRRPPSGGEFLPLLRALLPSFSAGLDALARLSTHRHTLDAVSEPVAAFDADGRLLHRNAALTRLLTPEPERDRVEVELRVLARRLRALAFPLRYESPGAAGLPAASREVATARGRYTLRGVLLPPGGSGFGESTLVSVSLDAPPALPEAEAVRTRHGLTKREAEVALLLAEGLSNADVAERLFVSPHTARHHVENVLSKLGLTSRAAVAARLMGTA